MLPRCHGAPGQLELFLDDVRRYLIEVEGWPTTRPRTPSSTCSTPCCPAARREFPLRSTYHDYAAWHAAVIETKQSGHLSDWPTVAPALRSFGPGTFTVDDSRKVCTYEMGRHAEINPWDAWDLDSVVSRPVALQN